MTQLVAGLEHDNIKGGPIKKGSPKGAQNKGQPRRRRDKRMKPKAPEKQPSKHPWGDEWIHPDNPALYDPPLDEDD